MMKGFDDVTELSTYILLVRTLIAAAWSDGPLQDRERDLIKSVISRVRMSDARREIMLIEAEQQPDEASVDHVLQELCHRAKTQEMKDAIVALVDMMIISDHKTEASEIEFREKLRGTLRFKGKNFFDAVKDRFLGRS